MDELDGVIANAAAAIEERYFRLPIYGGHPVYRERVYCYELYHQMRVRWPDDCSFTLNGEVDKRAHPIIQGLEAANTIPDFLVHVPGHMGGNYAVIEVKSVGPKVAGIQRDLEKIALFHKEVGYRRGIYLIFGEGAEDDVGQIYREARIFDQQGVVELWIHDMPGVAARRIPNPFT